MGYVTPYTYKGYTYHRGDELVVSGSYYATISATSASGSVSNAKKYFYGVYVNDDGTLANHPLGLMNSSSHSSVTFGQMNMDAIKSGGTGATYTVTINMNGGTANGLTSFKPTIGTDGWCMIASNIPTRTGYKFNGLWTKSSGGEQIYNADGLAVGDGTYWEAYQVGDGTIGYKWIYPGNVTLYAQWTKYYLTVHYYSNYATSYNGTTASLNAVNNDNVLVYKLNYYYDTAYSTGLLDYSSGSTLGMVKTGHTGTGKWGTSTSGGTLIDQKTGFSTGADLAKALGKNINSGNASINVYAQWAPNEYEITYKSNGGTGSDQTQTATYGISWTTKGAVFSRTGYTLESWNTNADGSGTSYSLDAGQTDKQLNNVILYAQWKANNYTLTLNANGGTVPSSSVSMTYDSNVNGSFTDWNMPTRNGYKFKGWYTSETDGVQVYDETGYRTNDGTYFSEGVWKYADNVTLYAQWEVLNVAYYKSDGAYMLHNTYVKTADGWVKAIPYIKVNGEFKRGTV